MNKTVKNLLLNLYFLKQIIKQNDAKKAKMYIENESGLEIEQLIEDPGNLNFEEIVAKFTLALSNFQGDNLESISEEYINFFRKLYYLVTDLESDFITKEEIDKDLNVLFRFPLFESTLLHYVQNEMIKDLTSFNNVVLSTYIHVSHIRFLCLIDEKNQLLEYLDSIGVDSCSSSLDLNKHEVELLLKLQVENKDYADAIINYFNNVCNEVITGNTSEIIVSCEYILKQLSQNIYIKNIL